MASGDLTENQVSLQERLNAALEREAELRSKVSEKTKDQTAVSRDFFSVFEEGSSAAKKSIGSQQDLAASLDSVANSQRNVSESSGFLDKAMLFLRKTTASLKMGFNSLLDTLTPLWEFVTLKPVFGWLAEQSATAAGNAGNAFEAYQQLKETLGILPNTLEKFDKFVKSSSVTLAQMGESVSSFAGIDVGDVRNKFLSYAGEMGQGFDLFMEKASGAHGAFVLFREGLGLATDAIQDMVYNFGKDSFGDFAKILVGGSEKLNLSLKNVSKNFNAAIKDSSNFGYMTRKELSATTLYATKLGMEMSELTGFADKFDTFEGAAESVGKLSAAFGIQLDTMSMVMEDNPAKKLDMVREALEKSGKSMDTILGDRRQAKYLSDTLGIPLEQLKKLQQVSTDEFGFSDAIDAAAEAQDEMTEMDALKSIADNIRDIKNSMSGSQKTFTGFFDAIKKGFADAYTRTAAYRHITGTMQKSFTSFYNIGKKVADLVGRLFYNPSLAGKKGADGRIMTAEDAPLYKYFMKPFIDYFRQMQKAADTLMKKGGPLDQVFEFITAVLNGDTSKIDKKFKDFNIFQTLFAPFRDVSKPTIFNPEIMEGLKRVGILLLEALADAFEFVGLEAVNWVTKLIDPPKVEKKLGQQTTMRDFQRVAEKAWDKLGGAFGDLLEAGGGLVAYLFGGTFRGRNIPYEESLFGKMFAQTEEASSEPGLFEGIANNIFSGLSNIFGLEKMGAIFALQGTGIGEKFEMGLLLMEAKMYRSLANLVNNMATWGKETVTRMEKDGVEGLDALNLPYQLAKGLASLGDFKDPHSASGALKKMADEADAAAANMRAGMEMLDQRIREEILDFESKTKSLGFSDEGDAIKSLRDQFGEYLTIDENDTSRIIEINSKNIKEIISALEKSNYDYNPNVSGESQSFDMTSITISKQAAEEISKANDSAIQTINESFGESLVDVGSSVSSDLTDGLQMGLESSIEDLSQSGADMASAIEDGIRNQSETQSPSMVFYNVGVDMADGLLAGFFGDESLIPGSSVTGFISQFNSRMVEVDQMIQDSYRNISEAAVVAISTKLGRVGEVLSGDKPLQVVVDNQKLEIKVQLHVNMDSRDVASGIASAAGGSYFTVNENRNKSARNFRALEID